MSRKGKTIGVNRPDADWDALKIKAADEDVERYKKLLHEAMVEAATARKRQELHRRLKVEAEAELASDTEMNPTNDPPSNPQ